MSKLMKIDEESNHLAEWYLSDGDKIVGPYSTSNLVHLDKSLPLRKDSVMVSRSGLDRWYPMSEMIDLLRLGENREQNDVGAVEETLQENMQQLSQREDMAALTEETFGLANKVKGKKIGWGPSPQSEVRPSEPSEEPKIDVCVAEQSEESLGSTPEQRYLLLRGRLRLGEVRSPLRVAVVDLIFSLGFSVVSWVLHSSRELQWHIEGKYKSALLVPAAFAYFPLLNLYHFARVAHLLKKAEEQNGYVKTRPMVAIVLGLFPPAAIFYLQHRLNIHWFLHAKGS